MIEKTLLLVDGSSYFYRAFHALPPLMNSKGQMTGAVYGVISMLKRLLKDYSPQYIAVIFDAKGENFRHKLYDKYKIHRPPMPEALSSQFEPLCYLVKAMGLPVVSEPQVEADDVIATLATKAQKEGFKVVISTGDKDLAQLVNDHIFLINTMTQMKLDYQGVIDKFGISPEQIADYLSLVGDKSDNIPGVAGVGPKTAIHWLKTYGSLDNLIIHREEIKGKIGDTLRHSLEQLALSRQLTQLKQDVPLNFSLESLRPFPLDEEQWTHWLKELEFKSWLKSEQKKNEENTSPRKVQYSTILTQSLMDAWIERIKKAPYFAIDTETTNLIAINAELVGISFSVSPGEAAYLPLAHDYLGAPTQLDKNKLLRQLKPLLEDATLKKIGQNLKYDYTVFKKAGIELQGMHFDTMLESYMQNSGAGRHDMDTLALRYLDYKTLSFEEIAGKKGEKQLTFNQIDLEKATFYACEDADITFQLHEHLWPILSSNSNMATIFHTIEMPLVKILATMEYHGVLVDPICLNEQSKMLAERLKLLESQAFALAGEVFNLQSPKQLQKILFEKNQLPILQKTPKGQPSTNEEALQELALFYPLPKIILEHRTLSKLKSTYTDALPLCIHPKTGRIHTSYNQAVTSTGRLSSSQPNLQNIPVRSEEGRKIRQAFIAPKDYQLLSVDYSQIELRLMAHLSQDPTLLKAFADGLDIHQATAAEVNNISLHAVTPEQRRQAKAINFGLIYGMSSYGLAKQLEISREEAQAYMDIYFSRYPKVQEFMEKTRAEAKQLGYVETILGRRMVIPDIHANDTKRQRAAERAAVNAPLQGSAADIIKLAMIHTDQWIRETHQPIFMILQVHDELVFEIPVEKQEENKQQIKKLMENVVSLAVPLEVSIGVGNNWDEAH